MKKAMLLCLIALGACAHHTREESAVLEYMKENANDPGSYEPISFRFIGPATYDNTGLIPHDSTRRGDLYEHTFRAKNGFGATMLTTKVFYISVAGAEMLPDSLGERAIMNFRP